MMFALLLTTYVSGVLSSAAPLCNLAGNWTDRANQKPGTHAVHIEFWQEPGSAKFTLRTTPWGSILSYGNVIDAGHVQLLFVGGSMKMLTIGKANAPGAGPCTQLSSGWCKFPYCGFPEPHWERWDPPIPAPTPPPPFPPPTWKPNWNLTESTTIQPSGDSYFIPNHTWGLVSLDWTVARSVWFKNGRNQTDCEWVSREGCRRLKAAGKASKCFIYHNMELALEWEETQRKVMYDPTKSDYFLQYTDGLGHKNGTIYAENIEWGDQFFWDYTNPEAAKYYISSVLQSLDDSAVDGTFTDDVGGVPQEHQHVMERINMTTPQLTALKVATQATHTKLVGELIKAGKYNWQAFGGGDGVGSDCPSSPSGCITFMRKYCDPAMQERPMMMGAGHASNQTIAAFLITRPPIGFIGWGWESDDRKWPSSNVFLLQPGMPQGLCKEEAHGVYSRLWSNGKAVLNCSSWTASLPFPSLDQVATETNEAFVV